MALTIRLGIIIGAGIAVLAVLQDSRCQKTELTHLLT